MSAPVAASNFWRAAGLNYLQYLNASTRVVRAATKEPLKSKIAAQNQFGYNRIVGDVKTFVTN